MKEAKVVSIICDHFVNEKWQFWIDDHPIHNDLEYQKHSILIGGARPDIYGLNPFKQIFAVEVKGLSDYKKAIGQAIIYKSGVNLSYIGGLESPLDKISNAAISSGLGIISVNESDEKVKILDPLYNTTPIYLEDIKNELAVLQNQKKINRSFSSFGRTHILNYFSPLFLFENVASRSKNELIKDFKIAQWRNKTYSEFISGANTIGLIDLKDKGYSLSKIGKFCLDYFKSQNIDSLEMLQNTLENTSRQKSVYTELPILAKFLQLIYFQNPDFKKFVTILLDFNKLQVSSKEIIDKFINDYPNLFLNFFVKPREKSRVIDILLSGKKEILLENYNKTIELYGHYNFFFAFKRHLVHLGILSQENKTYYGKTEDFDVNSDIWELGDEILI